MHFSSSSGCVLSTVRDAADKDYNIFVVEDCCADGKEWKKKEWKKKAETTVFAITSAIFTFAANYNPMKKDVFLTPIYLNFSWRRSTSGINGESFPSPSSYSFECWRTFSNFYLISRVTLNSCLQIFLKRKKQTTLTILLAPVSNEIDSFFFFLNHKLPSQSK